MTRMLSTACLVLALAGTAEAADTNLYGRYVYYGLNNGVLRAPEDCRALLADHVAGDGEEITVTPTGIVSDAEGYGPVTWGATDKGETRFTMTADMPGGTVVTNGTASRRGPVLVLDYGDRKDAYCPLGEP